MTNLKRNLTTRFNWKIKNKKINRKIFVVLYLIRKDQHRPVEGSSHRSTSETRFGLRANDFSYDTHMIHIYTMTGWVTQYFKKGVTLDIEGPLSSQYPLDIRIYIYIFFFCVLVFISRLCRLALHFWLDLYVLFISIIGYNILMKYIHVYVDCCCFCGDLIVGTHCWVSCSNCTIWLCTQWFWFPGFAFWFPVIVILVFDTFASYEFIQYIQTCILYMHYYAFFLAFLRPRTGSSCHPIFLFY